MQQAFGSATSMSIGYFGNHGLHELIQNQSANAFGFGTLPPAECTSPPVPPCADPRFGGVTEYTTAGISNYNGMVVSFQHRFAGWSKAYSRQTTHTATPSTKSPTAGLSQFAFGSSVSPAGSE